MEIQIFTMIGIYLLYMPPTFTFMFQRQLCTIREALTYKMIIITSFLLTVTMTFLMIESYYVFVFYFILFNLLFFYVERLSLDRVQAFSLAVYGCFAISVLWEWPIQLTIRQFLDAVILSGLKAVGIFFFFYYLTDSKFKVNDRLYSKFKVNDRLWFMIMLTVFIGVLITLGIWFLGIGSMFYVAHAYRLPWVIILFYSVYLAYKPLNKDIL